MCSTLLETASLLLTKWILLIKPIVLQSEFLHFILYLFLSYGIDIAWVCILLKRILQYQINYIILVFLNKYF